MAAPNGFIKNEIRLTNRAYDEMDRVQSEAKEVTEKALSCYKYKDTAGCNV